MDPKSTRLISWDGDLPEVGHYLKTHSGSVYLIIGMTRNTRPEPKSIAKLDLLKFTSDEITDIPDDAVIHYFQWNARR